MERRVNIGCGQTPTPDWYNYDNSPSLRLARYPLLASIASRLGLLNAHQRQYIDWLRRHHVQWANATRRIPLPDESIEVVYSSHMLEHLDRREVQRFLGEVWRILETGGKVRIVVPDLKMIVDKYLVHGDADRMVEETHLATPKPTGFTMRLRYLWVGGRHHHWMYDAKSLTRLFTEAGFINVCVLQPGQTTIENAGELNLHEREEVSLFIEAEKPAHQERS